MFEKKKNYDEIIRNYYLHLLNREPDDVGLQYYKEQMQKGIIDEDILKKTIEESLEYKTKKASKLFDKEKPFLFKGLYDISYVIYPNSALDHIVCEKGVYDTWISNKLKNFIPLDSIIFDIGANSGLLSLPFAKNYVPKGTVYSFEPDNRVIRKLKENVSINQQQNIVIVPIALQDNNAVKKLVFYQRQALDNDGRRHNALSSIERYSDYEYKEVLIDVSTIDDYVQTHGISQLSLIKIDVDGTDSKVLAGGRKTIDTFLPIIIYEYAPYVDILVDFKNTQYCFEFLKEKGYRQYQIIDEERLCELKEYSPNLAESNIICFHKSKVQPSIT